MKQRKKDPTKIGPIKFFSWVLQGTSLAVQFVVLNYLMMYSTTALGLNAGVVGTVLLATKFLDGFVDLFFGVLIDRTNTRWGKGRPFDLLIILLWGSTWAIFSVPVGLSDGMKYAWIFVFYTLAMTVARSLMQAAGLPYQVRAFNNEHIYNKINGYGGILSIALVMVVNIFLPRVITPIVSNPSAWSRVILMIAVPMTIIGLLRFFIVKEVHTEVDATADVVKLSDVVNLVKHNRNVVVLFAFQLIYYAVTGLGLQQYFFQFVYGDLSAMGMLAMFGMIPMFSLLVYPTLLKRISVKRLIQFTSLTSIVTTFTYLLYPNNFSMVAVGGIFWGFSSLAPSYMFSNMLIDAANYNEWKGYPRMEGVIAGLNSFFNNSGAALGVFIGGLILTWAGLQSGTEIQSAETVEMIKIGYAIIPTVGTLIASALLHFYKIDDTKEQMMEEIKQRRMDKISNATPVEDLALEPGVVLDPEESHL